MSRLEAAAAHSTTQANVYNRVAGILRALAKNTDNELEEAILRDEHRRMIALRDEMRDDHDYLLSQVDADGTS